MEDLWSYVFSLQVRCPDSSLQPRCHMLVNHRDTLPSIPKGAAAVKNNISDLRHLDFFQLKVKTKLWTILIPIPNRGMLGWFWNAVGAKISWVHEKTEHSLFWGRHCQICQLWGHTNLQLLFSKHLLFVVIDNSILGKAVKAPVGYSQHFNLLRLFFFFFA